MSSMVRGVWFLLGLSALALGIVGMAVPLLPTVPFLLLAAFCLARSSPRMERWLLEHRHFGPPIHAWRDRGAIGRRAKIVAGLTLAGSAAVGFFVASWPWSLLPVAACLIAGGWILTRPEA